MSMAISRVLFCDLAHMQSSIWAVRHRHSSAKKLCGTTKDSNKRAAHVACKQTTHLSPLHQAGFTFAMHVAMHAVGSYPTFPPLLDVRH